MKNNTKRKGFTLVELLIVIVVIGILSAMMMLSSTEAVTSSRAADIISDLRNMKTAALEWYSENIDYVEGKRTNSSGSYFTKLSNEKTGIIKFLGKDELKSNYLFGNGKDDDTWYACCKVQDEKVFAKLKSRANNVGLYFMDKDMTSGTDLATTTAKTGTVGLFIR